MYIINLQLLFLAWNIIFVCSFSMADVCDANDDHCLHPNVLKPGEIVLDKCIRNSTLLRLQDISLLACIQSCIVTSACTSVSYRKNWHLCDINGAPNDKMSAEKGCVFTKKSSWSNRMGGKCAEHDCKKGTQCIGKHTNGKYHCKLAYCIGDPHVRDAILVEKFGIYRNVGHAVKYNCTNGLKMTGRPFAVCNTTGNWKNLFACGDIPMVSAGKKTNFSSPFDPPNSKYPASYGVDRDKTNFFHTGNQTNPYWWVDLEKNYSIVRVVATNRIDCCGERLKLLIVYVGSTLNNADMKECGRFVGPGKNGQTINIECTEMPEGNYVKLVNDVKLINVLHLAEVEVFGFL